MPVNPPDLAALLHHHSAVGASDAITDVTGTRVGHTDIRDGSTITGVTAITFDQLGPDRMSLPAAVFTGNGYGKLIGSTQVDELGELETPIVLTNTLSAWVAADALAGWVLARPEHARTRSLNPVVAECNDGWLSDIRARRVQGEHVVAALEAASPQRPATGAVGAGSGMVAMGYKAGIGTASRTAAHADARWTVGVLALSNFSGDLRIGDRYLPAADVLPPAQDGDAHAPRRPKPAGEEGNSCVLTVVTDAPVDARQLGRLARRAVFALGRVGAAYAHGSGDYAIAVSTAAPAVSRPADAELDPLLTATLEAAEAALVDSLLSASTTTGRDGRVAHALPVEAALP
ncbi:P1 family peptidase [Dermacoccaceae bacterium W4C1]